MRQTSLAVFGVNGIIGFIPIGMQNTAELIA
jgi:hypothetical protein